MWEQMSDKLVVRRIARESLRVVLAVSQPLEGGKCWRRQLLHGAAREVPSSSKSLQLQTGNKIENNRPASNYRRYSFILNRKQYVRIKITDITGVTVVTVKNKKKALARSWSDVGGAHIQAFTFSSQDHSRLSDKHCLVCGVVCCGGVLWWCVCVVCCCCVLLCVVVVVVVVVVWCVVCCV